MNKIIISIAHFLNMFSLYFMSNRTIMPVTISYDVVTADFEILQNLILCLKISVIPLCNGISLCVLCNSLIPPKIIIHTL